MLQEASLTFGIQLDWPQILLGLWAWISPIFNFQIAFSGPECFGDGSGGFEARWWANAAMAPVALILFHVIVFQIRKALGKERVASQAVGSFVLWCKLIYMMIIQSAFEIWVCSTPGTVTTLDADPSIECPAIAKDANGDHSEFAIFSILMMVGAALLLVFISSFATTHDPFTVPLCGCPGTMAHKPI